MKKLHSRECGFYEPARGFSVPFVLFAENAYIEVRNLQIIEAK